MYRVISALILQHGFLSQKWDTVSRTHVATEILRARITDPGLRAHIGDTVLRAHLRYRFTLLLALDHVKRLQIE